MKRMFIFIVGLLALPHILYAQSNNAPKKDPAMEAKIRQAWSDIRQYSKQQKKENAQQIEDPQHAYAKEFFAYFQAHSETPTGIKSGQSAFMMWGNLGALENIEKAIQKISPSSKLWGEIQTSIGNAYGRNNRWEDYILLLTSIQNTLTDPKGRSEILLRLASHYSRENQIEKAKAYYAEITNLKAHPFDVQKAEGALYELDTLNIGQVAPDFTVQTIDGTPITLSSLRGKVVLLEFWATNCGPCLPEIPHLKNMNESYSNDVFQIIGITDDKDLQKLNQFLKSKQMTWPQVQQLAQFENEILKQDKVRELYNIFWIPRSFLIDRSGLIAAKDLRGEALEKAVSQLVTHKTVK